LAPDLIPTDSPPQALGDSFFKLCKDRFIGFRLNDVKNFLSLIFHVDILTAGTLDVEKESSAKMRRYPSLVQLLVVFWGALKRGYWIRLVNIIFCLCGLT
jgi:hypothetical protein